MVCRPSSSEVFAIDLRTPLMLASTAKGTQCVSLLLKSLNKAQLNDTDNEGMTALHWSAYNNTTDCLKAIVKAVSQLTSSRQLTSSC